MMNTNDFIWLISIFGPLFLLVVWYLIDDRYDDDEEDTTFN